MSQFKIVSPKDYATEANAVKAVEKAGFDDLRFFLMTQTNAAGLTRHFPVFIGEKAMQRGVHFHFNVVG